MRFGILLFPASNCADDCFKIIKDVMKKDVEYIWHKDEFKDFNRYDCIIIPGGFSYGDYLRPGAIARFSPAMEGLIEYAKEGRPVIGICNGFQILLEASLLPGAMMRNNGLKFICKFTNVKVENNQTPFTNTCSEGQILKMPLASGDGNYYTTKENLEELKNNNQIIFRYSGENPNGSLDNIAGICNKEGNILGIMPHPDRSGEDMIGSSHGRIIFDSIIKYLEGRGK